MDETPDFSRSEPPSAPDEAAGFPAAAGPVAPGVPAAPPPLGPERLGRGLLFALPVIPAGVIVWVILWQWGFIASIVMFGVSAGATFLYRLGSGGRISRAGLWTIIGVTLVTFIFAFLGGLASDLAQFMGVALTTALGSSRFWTVFVDNVFGNAQMWGSYAPQILMSLLFAALGSLGTIRRVLRVSRSQS